MKIYKTYNGLPKAAQSCAVIIGNFDGVHLGHQQLIQQAREIADAKKLPLALLTFEPHPRRLFRADDPPFRITPFDLKCERLAQTGIDALYAVPFDWDFASQSADTFIQDVLIAGLNAAHIIVGYDFRFGQLRKGSPQSIIDAGLETTVIQEIADEGQVALSSSRIRQALRHGKIAEANALLGWEWEIWGTVTKGDQRGRELGYPTANMALADTIHPAYGIYAAMVQIEGETHWRPAATNIGIRPMFEVPTAQVESYIFDFDQEIYDQILKVRPVQRLRGEAKFDSLEALIAQMDDDCRRAREILE